jgi:hypothetical protein
VTPILPTYLHFGKGLGRNTRRLELNFSDHKISPVDTSRSSLPARRHPLTSPCIRVLISKSMAIGATFLHSLSFNNTAIKGEH